MSHAGVSSGKMQLNPLHIHNTDREDDEESDALLSEEEAELLYFDVVDFFNWVEPEEQTSLFVVTLIGSNNSLDLDPAKATK